MKTTNNGGISFLQVLQLIFISFKLSGIIDWEWGKVLIPAYIWLALLCVASVMRMTKEGGSNESNHSK